MRRQLITLTLFAGLALGPSAAAAVVQQSPDARDADAAAQRQRASVRARDPRSPDARDANVVAQSQRSTVGVADPRSPDARDASRGVRIAGFPISAPTPPSRGFNWGDAGIGAGGMLAVALLGLGAAVAVQHRRRTPAAPLAR